MKFSRLFAITAICLLFSSCFDMKETFSLKADGSYEVDYDMNMGKMITMLMAMAPDSVSKDESFSKSRDTTMNMASLIPDSSKATLSTKEIKAIENTDMRLNMDMKEGIFQIAFHNKGNTLEELHFFISDFGSIMKKSNTKKILSGGAGDLIDTNENNDNNEGSEPFANKEFDQIITPNSFERKVKPEVMAKKLDKDKKVYAMMEGMNMNIPYTITINLPRPAKSVENAKAVLSADKRQFKLELDMFEVIKNPELLNFKVAY